jgi:hypothetical protein
MLFKAKRSTHPEGVKITMMTKIYLYLNLTWVSEPESEAKVVEPGQPSESRAPLHRQGYKC